MKKIAPEYYDTLPYYTSWTKVMLGFIFGGDMSMLCRVKRENKDK